MTIELPLDADSLASDAIGGFASGTGAGYRTRRYPARMNSDDATRRDEVRTRFLAPLQANLRVAGLSHVSEIAGGDAPPRAPRGCPFQAWSTGQLIGVLARTAPQTEPTATP